ncbi:MAG: hypothetical protein ACJA01_003188 [Saprospiraceae bacterium]|jgi:hypothetical protein
MEYFDLARNPFKDIGRKSFTVVIDDGNDDRVLFVSGEQTN